MQIKEKSYPHPVLSNFSDDFPSSEFSLKIEVNDDRRNILIDYEFILNDEGIRSYIENKKATFVLHLECNQTLFRKYYRCPEGTGTIIIKNDDLEGKVEVNGFISATENIDNYYSTGMHEDYENEVFNLENGDILGVVPDQTFSIHKSFLPLEKTEDIFKIVSSKDAHCIQVDYEENEIKIIMPEDQHNKWKKISHIESNIHFCTIILPVLTQVIDNIKYKEESNLDSYKEYRWFNVLNQNFKNLKINWLKNSEDGFVLAQQLLMNPYKACFVDLIGLYERGEDSVH